MFTVIYDPETGQAQSVTCSIRGINIPNESANSDYSYVLDAIIAEGAACFDGDIPAELQAAADEKQFNQQLAAYRAATARLAQYRLADGRPELTEMQPTGEQVFNEETGEMEAVMAEVIVQTAIDPLEATVEQTTYDDEGNATNETVDNPLIVADDAERAAAQAVVDSTPQEVKDFA